MGYKTRHLNMLGSQKHRSGRIDPPAVNQVITKSDKTSTLISNHWHAVSTYLSTGNTDDLEPFEGKSFGGIELVTDPDIIDELWERGELDIESIYASVGD